MKLEELIKHVDVVVHPSKGKGNYWTSVKGNLISGEYIDLHIELEDCFTPEIIEDTLRSKLEEILSCKYHYEIGDVDEESLHYDGGNFI